jgi:hypothetical protein
MTPDLFARNVKEIALLREELKKIVNIKILYRGMDKHSLPTALPKLSNKKITEEDCKDLETLKKALDEKKPILFDPAFLSTSKELDWGEADARTGGLVLKITPETQFCGKDVTAISHYGYEEEVLLKSGQKLQVISSEIKNGRLYVDVETVK